MALHPVIWDGTIAPGQEATSGPGPAPHPALPYTITRYCEGCNARAYSNGHTLDRDGWVMLVDNGRETGKYFGPCCWPADRP